MKCTGVTGRNLDHMIAEGDIKVGICDTPIEKAKCVYLEPYPDLDKTKFQYKGT